MNYKLITVVLVATLVLISCKKETENSQANPATAEKTATPIPEEDSKENAIDAKFAKMEFSKVEHDFGTINGDDKVETVFTFTNTGEADLVISKALGSCGCTVPDYPKQPIAPGEKADIKVSFSPKGKNGMQNKTVTLTVNTPSGIETLHIKANITK